MVLKTCVLSSGYNNSIQNVSAISERLSVTAVAYIFGVDNGDHMRQDTGKVRVKLLAQLAGQRREQLEHGRKAFALHFAVALLFELLLQQRHDLGQVMQQLRRRGHERLQLAVEHLEALDGGELGLQAQLLLERQRDLGGAIGLGVQLQLRLQVGHALIDLLEAVAPLLGRQRQRRHEDAEADESSGWLHRPKRSGWRKYTSALYCIIILRQLLLVRQQRADSRHCFLGLHFVQWKRCKRVQKRARSLLLLGG